MTTLSGLASNPGTQSANSWLGSYKPNPRARLRLFCFPYAGGGASIYQTWAKQLPDTVEVCPVQLPGRGARTKEKPFTDMMLLIKALAAALVPLMDKPYAFFGHSMGALIGFELARYVRRHRSPLPVHLFISGRSAPQITGSERAMSDLSEVEFIEELIRLNGTPREVIDNPELMSLMIPLLRADFLLCESYVYKVEAPLDCSISVFGGLQDVETGPEKLEGWREQTSRGFVKRILPGDHFFLHSQRAVLLQLLAQELYTHLSP
jgi:medium-chain acyl-[acyl-carrier-protein] hydrolase